MAQSLVIVAIMLNLRRRLIQAFQDPFRLLKLASVVSFVLAAFWLSQVTQPMYQCHSSSVLFGIVNSSSQAEGGTWFKCEWWDYLLPRKRLNEDEQVRIRQWERELFQLERLQQILPPLKSPLLVVRDNADPFTYQISTRQIRLGEEALRSSSLLFRALLQAWISQVDRSGLDAFQVETLADFLMVVAADKTNYRNPITGAKVVLTEQKYWPEDARSFPEYCLDPNVSLQHLDLCTSEAVQSELINKKPGRATIWSGRQAALSLLLKQWRLAAPSEAWLSLTSLKQNLIRARPSKPLPVMEYKVSESLDAEVDSLLRLLNLKPKRLSEEKVTHLVDWKAGELSDDFISTPAFRSIKKFTKVRVWLRYKGQFWDLRKGRSVLMDGTDVAFKHVVRVQCAAGGLDALALAAEQLTLIHHCQGPAKSWNLLFQGQLKKFLELHDDLAYLKLRPKELHRYLKWHPQHQESSWRLQSWEDWLIQFGVEDIGKKEAMKKPSLNGTWEVVEDLRLPYSETGRGS